MGIAYGVEEEESRVVQLLRQRTLGVFSELVVGSFVGWILDDDMTLKRERGFKKGRQHSLLDRQGGWGVKSGWWRMADGDSRMAMMSVVE